MNEIDELYDNLEWEKAYYMALEEQYLKKLYEEECCPIGSVEQED